MSSVRPASTARLQRWLTDQRWYAATAAGTTAVTIAEVETAAIDTGLTVAIVLTSDHEHYQLIQSDGSPDRATHPATARSPSSRPARARWPTSNCHSRPA